MERDRPDFSFWGVGLLEGEGFGAETFGLASGVFLSVALGAVAAFFAEGVFKILAAGFAVLAKGLEDPDWGGFFADDFAALGLILEAAAFLAVGAGLAGFPEVFRLGEGLVIFFNGARLEPVAQGRKDR